MSSQKLVRCEVERPDGQRAGLRFVPLEIFGLWEYLMEHRHGFRVRSRQASVWVELDEATGAAGVKSPVERVTEISLFVFDERDGMLSRVCRYAPADDLETVRHVLLDHYSTAQTASVHVPWIRERAGVWFRPREEPEALAEAGASGAVP